MNDDILVTWHALVDAASIGESSFPSPRALSSEVFLGAASTFFRSFPDGECRIRRASGKVPDPKIVPSMPSLWPDFAVGARVASPADVLRRAADQLPAASGGALRGTVRVRKAFTEDKIVATLVVGPAIPRDEEPGSEFPTLTLSVVYPFALWPCRFGERVGVAADEAALEAALRVEFARVADALRGMVMVAAEVSKSSEGSSEGP